ncbi:DUF3341 domain-containing protein [soil metagenome]
MATNPSSPGPDIYPDIYGVVARFDTPEDLVAAAERVRDEGYKKIDAYTPFPVEGLTEALGVRPSRLGFIVLAGGITGALFGLLLQYFAMVLSLPVIVFGRPHFAWPAFIVPMFETTILFAAFSAVFGMLIINGLPRPYHSIFNAPGFEAASRDGFFLAIEADDPRFDRERSKALLETLAPGRVSEVEH